jgi:hypothetical protein
MAERGELKFGLRLRGEHGAVKERRREIFAYLHSLGFEPGGLNPREVEATVRGTPEECKAIRDHVYRMANDQPEDQFETYGSE